MSNKYCTFYIVRHGETEWNVAGKLQGHANSELTTNGIIQVESLREEIKDIHFEAIYSSDLSRTKKTAEILNIERKLAINTTKLLRERSFGEHEGKKGNIYRKEIRNLIEIYKKLADEQKKKYKYPGVETDEEIISRFIVFLRETATAYPDKKVLIVSHGGAMATFLIHLGYASYTDELIVSNASFAVIESDGVDFIIKETNGIIKK